MSLKRWISFALLVAFILVPMPVFADENFVYPVEGTFDTYKSLDLFVNNQLYLSAGGYGTVSDSSDLYSLDLDVYSVPFDYYTENSFQTSSNIGFSKLFTKSELTNYLTGKSFTSSANIDSNFQSIYGYKLILNYEDENGNANPLPKGAKVDLDLLLNDYAIGGGDYYALPVFDTYGEFTSYMATNNYAPTENINLLNFVPEDFLNSSSTASNGGYMLLTNHISVYGTSAEGQLVSIGEFDNISNLLVNLKVPEELTDITIDVSYNATDSYLNVVSGTGKKSFNVPLFFVTDISGTIALDDSGIVSGLIEGIIEWLKSILNAIQDLPVNIANKVSDAITALFIPSAEDMAGVYENATGLLEDRLGFIAQIVGWVLQLFDALPATVGDTQETITVPRLALPWPDDLPAFAQVAGNEIVIWEEFTFDIIPEGMDSLRNLLETVTSLWAVLALVMCCVDSYHGFVGESPMYRSSIEYQNTKDIAEDITGFRRKEYFGRRRW